MSRRPAQITQADVRRVIRAAKQEGAAEIEVRLGLSSVIVRLSTSEIRPVDESQENVL